MRLVWWDLKDSEDVGLASEKEVEEDGDRGGGLQLWDCTDLAGVRELLSIDGRALAGIGKIVYAAPLPLRPGQTEVFIAVL